MSSPRCLSVVVLICLLACSLWAAPGGVNPAVSNPSAVPAVSDDDGNAGIVQISEITIPGPLRSFLRMAGISQKIGPDEVIPLLSRNVYTQGYEGSSRQTEFLVLLTRYVAQARELAELAGTAGVIRVSNCEEAGPLLRILGYRTRPDCGHPGTSLLTADSERAFLAIDSGFPLPELEQTLQGGKPFAYPYSSSPVPVLFAESDWTKVSPKNLRENSRDLLDTILNDSGVARLYWALSRLDSETGKSLEQSIGLGKLLPYAAVLDFYGRGLCIREGRVNVPGGAGAEHAWKDLVGASPESPASFVPKLLAKDKGWLAAYFDVLSRVSGTQQAYFTNPHRLPLFYEALRTSDRSVAATRGSFRPAPTLLLLTTRLQLESSDDVLVPGNLEVWKDILQQGHNVRRWGKQLSSFTSSDQLVRVLFALSRAPNENGPLQSYLAISELDSRRSPGHRLTPATVRLLARKFEEFSDQYWIFSEFPELNDDSIALFLEVAEGLNNVPSTVRGNAF